MIVTLSDYYSDSGSISVTSDAGSGDILATKDYTAAQSYLSGGVSSLLRIFKTFSSSQIVNYIAICSHNISSDTVLSVQVFANGSLQGSFTPNKRTHNILIPFNSVIASNITIEINKVSAAGRVVIGFIACGDSKQVPTNGEHSGFSYGHLFTPIEVRTVANDQSQPTAGVTWRVPVRHTLSLPNISRDIVKGWWFDFTDAAKNNGWFVMLAEESEYWTASLCFNVQDAPRKAHSQTRDLVTSSITFTGDSGV